MARTKKVKDFEIDFKFPYRSRELLFNPDGTEKYDLDTIFSFFDAHPGINEHVKEFVASLKQIKTTNGAITHNQQYTLYNHAADLCPDWDALNLEFFAWYDGREDMQKMYRECSAQMWWHYDRYGQHHSKEDAAARGWLDRPDNWRMFYSLAYSSEASRYRELNRQIIYDIGDQVVLREPFKNSYRYDPCYQTLPVEQDRIGMVVEHKDSISRKSRGGKGSRLINVLWLSNGDQKLIPERCIKKYRAPKV